MRLVPLLLTLFPFVCLAQYQTGWRTDLYAGINSAEINPALPGRSPLNWELNLVDGSFFVANNYAYVANEGLISLVRKSNETLTARRLTNLPSDVGTAADNEIYYDFRETNRFFAQQLVKFTGPSLSFRVGENTRIGLVTQAWGMTSITGLDGDFGYDRWNAILAEEDIRIDPVRFATATWASIGLNVNQTIPLADGDLVLGASVHRLYSERGAYIFSDPAFVIQKTTDYEGLRSANVNLEGGYTNNISDTDFGEINAAYGWGADLGVLYRADLGDDFYRWEIGAAVTNLGNIRFNQGRVHRFNTNTLAEVNQADYENFDEDDIDAALEQLSSDVLGLATLSLVDNNFALGLPTSLNLNASYAFTRELRLEGSAMIGLALRQASLRQQSVVAVTPRYDHKWFSLALPVSLYAGEQLRLGLNTRLGPFFLGTDQLGSIFGTNEFTGTDLYAGVRLFPFWKGSGSSKRRKKGRKRGGYKVECYKF